MLNTMGVNGNLQPMKDCFRIGISATSVAKLKLDTLRLVQTMPARDASRFITVRSVTPAPVEPEVFCFTEGKNHSGIFNGVYTANCGEQPLPPYGACLLGSINLARMVKNPFTDGALPDLAMIADAVSVAIRMMDNVVDVSKFPLPAQEQEAKDKRRLGLGVTGLADMLVMVGIKYGSVDAVALTDEIMELVDEIAYQTSSDLAREKGSFPLFDADSFLAEGTHASTLSEKTKASIRKNGIRNSHLTSVAPWSCHGLVPVSFEQCLL